MGAQRGAFLNARGRMAALIDDHDWKDSALGLRESWPHPLKTLCDLLLAAKQPMFVVWGEEGTLIYNDAYAEILADKHPLALGQPFLDVWSEIRGDLIPIVRQTMSGEPVHMDDITLVMNRRGYSEVTHFSFSYTPVEDESGEVGGLFCACMETTERVRLQQALLDSEQRANRLLESIADGFIALDRDWRITFLNNRGEEILRPLGKNRLELIGKNFWGEFPETAFTAFGECYRRAMDDQEASNVEDFYPPLDTWFDVRAYPAAEGICVHFLDISERKGLEKQREFLIGELNHRVKNTLAVVQGLAFQTFKNSSVPADLLSTFQSRLAALAATHSLLTQSNWQNISLGALVRQVVEASCGPCNRVTVTGPPLTLAPKQAVTVAMAMHELCTNALKYGALSVDGGRVDVAWSVSPDSVANLEMTWAEHGGPPVEPAGQRGFGSRVLEGALAQDFDGEVSMDFRRDGLVCTLRGTLPEGSTLE